MTRNERVIVSAKPHCHERRLGPIVSSGRDKAAVVAMANGSIKFSAIGSAVSGNGRHSVDLLCKSLHTAGENFPPMSVSLFVGGTGVMTHLL